MPSLDDSLQTAQRALDANRDGALERGQREQIWSALGPRDDVGRSRRPRLAIEAVTHELPRWYAVYPQDDAPERLLDEARAVLAGRVDPAHAARLRGSAWTRFDDLASDDNTGAIAIGYAAAQALGAAHHDEDFAPDSVDLMRRDADVDPETHDASYLVSVAEATSITVAFVAGTAPYALVAIALALATIVRILHEPRLADALRNPHHVDELERIQRTVALAGEAAPVTTRAGLRASVRHLPSGPLDVLWSHDRLCEADVHALVRELALDAEVRPARTARMYHVLVSTGR